MLFVLLGVLLGEPNGASDFHYYKPTPFGPLLQAANAAIRHILRHTGRSGGPGGGPRHRTSMPVKYGSGPMRQLRIRGLTRLEWLMTTLPARTTDR